MLALIPFISLLITPTLSYTQLVNTTAELQIRDKLALYAYATDGKKPDLFEQVFTEDVFHIYNQTTPITTNPPNSQVEAIKTYITTAVTGKLTQHTLSSLLVETLSPAPNASTTTLEEANAANINSTTYLVANFFGQGNLTGKLLVFYHLDYFVRFSSSNMGSQRAWVTLLTRSSYLPGVITLAHSLSVHRSAYPLIVLVTPSLPEPSLEALRLESKYNSNLIIHPIELLLPPDGQRSASVASRFEDTWTKLRAFQLTSYDTCAFLDADLTVYKNMDEVFDINLPGEDWIAANHACVCNLDHDSWAPGNWTKANCAFTPLHHPNSLTKATQIPPSAAPPDTYALLNSGFFLYHPSPELWEAMHDHFQTSSDLSTYQFPDQDFLAHYFRGKWLPLSWKYNALKTMENWHRNIWRDEEVMGLHYIVDKPWEKRVASDDVGGHLGRDGKTHKWWWNVWEDWVGKRRDDAELVGILEGLVAKPLSEDEDKKQCAENKEKGLPIPIPGSHGQPPGK
ncbi:MAG: hypothetical protein Q9168_008176 [Polycauliona sp. 1 TL-2023]